MSSDDKLGSGPVTVKIVGRVAPEWLYRQLPGQDGVWSDCRFVTDPDENDYDWLVVYHDLAWSKERRGMEFLACAGRKSILVTTEPSSITVYGTDYLKQFGTIITSQEPWVIHHPNPVFTMPGLLWFYGMNEEEASFIPYDDLRSMVPPVKERNLSTVCSNRRGRLTLHSKRVHFTQRLKACLPEMDVFGHGVKPMADKAEALNPYRYHITIENHICCDHMTEKLPDAFLGHTLPFYHGCPNASEYFPKDSYVPIDIDDFDKSLDLIQSTIANNEYEDRLSYILEARRRVLEEYNLFEVIEKVIRRNPDGAGSHEGSLTGCIMNRQTLRIKRPLTGIRSLWEKVEIKGRLRIRGMLRGQYP
ncbi:glycosyltransferase family 10 domain-containing protein [Desulfobotulus mexicanus]|uniref:Fucosyltransferase C-terminal domain-containing protein n=1 Tax=Desulfobotulus mexicanus TaxID=2586642 RepID=A0A5S5MBZ2_9BACT|nr:glycosyltransferase family 10 [Desulfobotulus mexicanus]TYT73169.1 hypothetical protein FIM25_16520 [Desulfobotulus mexicanus]